MRYTACDMRNIIDLLEDINSRYYRRNDPWRNNQDSGPEYIVSTTHPTDGDKEITVHATSPYEALMIAQEQLIGSSTTATHARRSFRNV